MYIYIYIYIRMWVYIYIYMYKCTSRDLRSLYYLYTYGCFHFRPFSPVSLPFSFSYSFILYYSIFFSFSIFLLSHFPTHSYPLYVLSLEVLIRSLPRAINKPVPCDARPRLLVFVRIRRHLRRARREHTRVRVIMASQFSYFFFFFLLFFSFLLPSITTALSRLFLCI